jgi:hypothetical protein
MIDKSQLRKKKRKKRLVKYNHWARLKPATLKYVNSYKRFDDKYEIFVDGNLFAQYSNRPGRPPKNTNEL